MVPYDDERASAALRLVRVGRDTYSVERHRSARAWLAPEAASTDYAATEAPSCSGSLTSCRTEDARIRSATHSRQPPGHHRRVWAAQRHRAKPRVIVASPYVALGLWVSGRCVVDGVANNEVSRIGFSGPGISYAKADGFWNGSAARTGRSRSGVPASSSTRWKPPFGSNALVRDSVPGANERGAWGGDAGGVRERSRRCGPRSLHELRTLMHSAAGAHAANAPLSRPRDSSLPRFQAGRPRNSRLDQAKHRK